MTKRQPEPYSLLRFFRGEKGFKHLVNYGVGDADAVVLHFQENAVPIESGPYPYGRVHPAFNGIHCIAYEIYDYLPERADIRLHMR